MRLGSKFGQFRINNKQIVRNTAVEYSMSVVRNKIEIRAD